ncbi:uncharacterized protein [Amphiura filiformis]|uniref:uncharacterized protein n=1 Tax=Amphiura filiformis TaxID=82378 RepID=UPI003B2106EA
MCIKTLPPVLVIHLKRIKMDWETGRASKFNDYFKFPQLLDMEPYTLNSVENRSRHTHRDETRHKGIKRGASTDENYYQLVGVVVHTGQASSGHYYSLIMDRHGDEKNNPDWGKWYKFNDSSVSPYDLTDQGLEEECFGGSYKTTWRDYRTYSSYIPGGYSAVQRSHSGYMLFYEKVDTSDSGIDSHIKTAQKQQTTKRMYTNSSAHSDHSQMETTESPESDIANADTKNHTKGKVSTTDDTKDKTKSSSHDKKSKQTAHQQLRSNTSAELGENKPTVSDSKGDPSSTDHSKSDKMYTDEMQNLSHQWKDKPIPIDHTKSNSIYASHDVLNEQVSSHHQLNSKTSSGLMSTALKSKDDLSMKDHSKSEVMYIDETQNSSHRLEGKPGAIDHTRSSSKHTSDDAASKPLSSGYQLRSKTSADIQGDKSKKDHSKCEMMHADETLQGKDKSSTADHLKSTSKYSSHSETSKQKSSHHQFRSTISVDLEKNQSFLIPKLIQVVQTGQRRRRLAQRR